MRGHKIDGTRPSQTRNKFGEKQGKHTEYSGQASSQQRTSSPGRDNKKIENPDNNKKQKHEQKSRSTIGGSEDTTIPSPGWSPKQPLPRVGLHDLPYGRQVCPEFNLVQLSSPGGWSNLSPGGAIFVPSPFRTGTNLLHPRPPQSLNDSKAQTEETNKRQPHYELLSRLRKKGAAL